MTVQQLESALATAISDGHGAVDIVILLPNGTQANIAVAEIKMGFKRYLPSVAGEAPVFLIEAPQQQA